MVSRSRSKSKKKVRKSNRYPGEFRLKKTFFGGVAKNQTSHAHKFIQGERCRNRRRLRAFRKRKPKTKKKRSRSNSYRSWVGEIPAYDFTKNQFIDPDYLDHYHAQVGALTVALDNVKDKKALCAHIKNQVEEYSKMRCHAEFKGKCSKEPTFYSEILSPLAIEHAHRNIYNQRCWLDLKKKLFSLRKKSTLEKEEKSVVDGLVK